MFPKVAAPLALFLVACGCVHSTHVVEASGQILAPRQILASPVQINVATEEGELRLQGAVFWIDMPRPPTGRPVVVFSHGSPMSFAEQKAMTPFGYLSAIQWFVERGYVVVACLRHGFGTSEGHFSEGVYRYHPDYTHAGRVAARDIRAVLDFLKTIPGLDLDRVVLAGHSAGGFGSLAHPREGCGSNTVTPHAA